MPSWADRRGIHVEYIQAGKRQRSAYIERYNRTVKYDWLKHYLFEIIEDVQEFPTCLLWTYNQEHLNMAVDGTTPKEKLTVAA